MVITEIAQQIKNENESDYFRLIMSAALYADCVKTNDPDEQYKNSLLSIITEILDKYGVKYENDLC